MKTELVAHLIVLCCIADAERVNEVKAPAAGIVQLFLW
jgi:hypothetical protein